jgi:hypothetical protein
MRNIRRLKKIEYSQYGLLPAQSVVKQSVISAGKIHDTAEVPRAKFPRAVRHFVVCQNNSSHTFFALFRTAIYIFKDL